MVLNVGNILLIGAILLLFSIIAGKASFRLGIPTLILFLIVGMLAGSEGLMKISFNDPKIAQFIGIISLNFILFSGGLETNWKSIKPILWQGISLSTIGVLITAAVTGTFIYFITDFSIYEGLLLGAIVSSTDAAAVFSILRSKNLSLKYNIRPLLELESGSNDPMANILTILFLSLVQHPDIDGWYLLNFFLKELIIGAMVGLLFGRLSKIIINRLKVELEGLYFVLVIALIFLTYSAADIIHGNGFLAVYLCAVFLGNQEFVHKKTIIKMFDGFAWLMQIILFLTLGLLVVPSDIFEIMGIGILVSIVLILIARPLSVAIALLPFKIKAKTKFYISWVGLRGAVPIVFATYPLIAGIDKAHTIFNIVFFISATSVLIQGGLIGKFAKWLHVDLPDLKKKSPIDDFLNDYAKPRMIEILVPENSYAVGKKIVDLNFPNNSIIAMISRKDGFITPSGLTIIEANDNLVILTDNKKQASYIYDCLGIEPPLEAEK